MPQVGMPIFNFILFFTYKLDTILKIILFQIKLGMKFVRSSIRKKKKKITLVYVRNIMCVRHKNPQPLLFLLQKLWLHE